MPRQAPGFCGAKPGLLPRYEIVCGAFHTCHPRGGVACHPCPSVVAPALQASQDGNREVV